MPSQEEAARSVLDSALQRACAVDEEIERLKGKDYAFQLPKQFLELLGKFTRKTIRDLKETPADPKIWDTSLDPMQRIDHVSTLATRAEWFHSLLRTVDRVDSTRLPFEVVRSFEALLADVLRDGSHVKLLLKPERASNYAIVNLGALFVDDPWKEDAQALQHAYKLSLPSSEPASMAMHTLFLHELGHSHFAANVTTPFIEEIALKALKSDAAKSIIAAETSARLRIELAESPKSAAQDQNAVAAVLGSQVEKEFFQTFPILFGAWTREVYADLFALRLVGPAYICAFQAFFLPGLVREGASRTHPDPVLRMKILRWALDRWCEGDPTLAALRERFAASLFEIPEMPLVEKRTHRFAAGLLDPGNGSSGVVAQLAGLIEAIPSPFSANVVNALQASLKGLNVLIPPNPYLFLLNGSTIGIRTAVAFTFSAIWLYRLSKYQHWVKTYDWTQDHSERVLNQLAQKAFEAADLERRSREMTAR